MRGRALPAALASVLVVALGLAVRAQAADAGAAPRRPLLPSPSAPVLSARRVADLLSDRVAEGRLAPRLTAALAAPAPGGGRPQVCLVVQVGHHVAFASNADVPLIPASNLKLLTAVAALSKLDVNEQLPTHLAADSPPKAGVIDGPLYVVGGGDPLIATAAYEASRMYPPPKWTPVESIADAVVNAGVHEIKGGVVGDESRFDQQRQIATWPARYQALGDIGPMSALELDNGFASFMPQHEPASSPPLAAATALTSLLRARGVAVDGAPAAGTAPAGAIVVATVGSLSVGDLVKEMLDQSDNDTAELLTKELGRRFGGAGTTAAGLRVVRSTLVAQGLPTRAWSSVDGSGLDRSDRATCTVLLDALAAGPHAQEIVDRLPVAASNGTLAHRFIGHRASGRLRAKTGSLDGVTALTGVFPGLGGPQLSFSFIANGVNGDAAGMAFADGIADILATYPDGPSAAALNP